MKIRFVPTGQELEADPNKTLLQMCNENKIEIKSICKGVPSCAECRIRLTEGEHNVLPPSKAELSLIGTNYFIDQRRLACQIRCFGDITVDLTEQINRADTQKKKVRGFRQTNHKSGHVETHAKQGTLVLEQPAITAEAPREQREPREPRQAQQPREPREPRQQQQGQQQGQGQGGQPGQGAAGQGKQGGNRNRNRNRRR